MQKTMYLGAVMEIIDDLLRDFFRDQRSEGFENRFYNSLHEDFQVILDRFRRFVEDRYDREVADLRRGLLLGHVDPEEIQKINDRGTILEWNYHEVILKIIEEIGSVKIELVKEHTKMLLDSAEEAENVRKN